MADPYDLDPNFEAAVVTLACTRPKFYGRIGYAIDPTLLMSAAARKALQAAHAISTDLGHGPDSGVLVIQRLRRWMENGEVTLGEVEAVADLLDDAEDSGLPSLDSVIIELAPVIRSRANDAAVRRAIDTSKDPDGDFSQVIDSFSRAGRIGEVDTAIGTVLGDGSFADIEALSTIDRLPIGYFDLDKKIDGGLARGQFGLVMGETGGGKSMFLTHIASTGIRLGIPTIYATLELAKGLILARIKAAITGVPTKAIMNTKEGRRECASRLDQMGPLGMLVVKDFPARLTTVEDLFAWVDEVEADRGERPVLVLIDYLDRLGAGSKGRDFKSGYDAQGYICDSLINWSKDEHNFLWSASQVQRKGGRSRKIIDTDDVADSMHKSRISQLGISMNWRNDQREIFYWICKNSLGESKRGVGPMPHDFAHGRLVSEELAKESKEHPGLWE